MMKIIWDDKICQHAAVCVKTLPSVFQIKDGKFVIIQNGASESKIREVVSKCPSGALQIRN
jgi:uncharacterized Fe-S cluster protein YjdI